MSHKLDFKLLSYLYTKDCRICTRRIAVFVHERVQFHPLYSLSETVYSEPDQDIFVPAISAWIHFSHYPHYRHELKQLGIFLLELHIPFPWSMGVVGKGGGVGVRELRPTLLRKSYRENPDFFRKRQNPGDATAKPRKKTLGTYPGYWWKRTLSSQQFSCRWFSLLGL
jgi:hypothetical protein